MTPEICERLTITCRKKRADAAWHPGDTIFEAARRMGLRPPCSCLAGSCGTCIARLVAGTVSIRHNEVLTAQELADGLILTCQALPTSPHVVIDYEN